MTRRLPWLIAGALAGFVAAVWTLAGIRRTRGRFTASSVASEMGDRAVTARTRVGAAVAEGRRTMREYEAEARSDAPVG